MHLFIYLLSKCTFFYIEMQRVHYLNHIKKKNEKDRNFDVPHNRYSIRMTDLGVPENQNFPRKSGYLATLTATLIFKLLFTQFSLFLNEK